MKKPNQSNTWNYEVVQMQVPHPIDGYDKLPYFGNFRTDTMECIGMASESYGLVQNKALLDAAHMALDTRGMSGFEEKVIVTGNGSRFFAEFAFKNRQLASSVGDIFGYKLVLCNSFDRTLRAAFQLAFIRLVCLNGASTLEKEFNVTRKHSTNVSVDFLGQAIDNALSNGQNALKVYDQMAQVALTDVQGINLLDNFVVGKVLSNSLAEAMKSLWLNPRRQEDKARNVYNLYNAVTEHLTHQISGEHYEYSGKVSNSVLFHLVNAVRKPAKLAQLILPAPIKGVQVQVDAAPIASATGANGMIIDVESAPA